MTPPTKIRIAHPSGFGRPALVTKVLTINVNVWLIRLG
jgi:hypothetical protein